MRRILVDHARRRGLRDNARGAAVHVTLDNAAGVSTAPGVDVVDTLALDRALQKLEQLDPEQARIVELRFFGGLTVGKPRRRWECPSRPSIANGPSPRAGCTAS